MLEVGWFSTKLLLKGKLLRNPGYFYQRLAVAVLLGALILVCTAKTGITPLWVSVVLSSLGLSILMPFLLKDVKMQ